MSRGRCIALAFALIALVGMARGARESLYDEKADAQKQIAAAIAEASKARNPGKNIVLVFGANWCLDCHALEAAMKKPELAPLVEKNFVVVKIDVGRFDKNVDVAERYGIPIRNGIPAIAILDPKGKLLHAVKQGEFAAARHMPLDSIKAFFEEWKPKR